jgi:predicted membrane-bound spermidine synthase
LGLVLVVVGAGTGATFALAGKAGNDAARAKAAHLYAADFVGGAVGAILFSTLLVPLLGVAIAPGAAAFLMAAVFLGDRVWQKSFADLTS